MSESTPLSSEVEDQLAPESIEIDWSRPLLKGFTPEAREKIQKMPEIKISPEDEEALAFRHVYLASNNGSHLEFSAAGPVGTLFTLGNKPQDVKEIEFIPKGGDGHQQDYFDIKVTMNDGEEEICIIAHGTIFPKKEDFDQMPPQWRDGYEG
jgi:hypothetical protein